MPTDADDLHRALIQGGEVLSREDLPHLSDLEYSLLYDCQATHVIRQIIEQMAHHDDREPLLRVQTRDQLQNRKP